jgi:hypothetical protein
MSDKPVIPRRRYNQLIGDYAKDKYIDAVFGMQAYYYRQGMDPPEMTSTQERKLYKKYRDEAREVIPFQPEPALPRSSKCPPCPTVDEEEPLRVRTAPRNMNVERELDMVQSQIKKNTKSIAKRYRELKDQRLNSLRKQTRKQRGITELMEYQAERAKQMYPKSVAPAAIAPSRILEPALFEEDNADDEEERVEVVSVAEERERAKRVEENIEKERERLQRLYDEQKRISALRSKRVIQLELELEKAKEKPSLTMKNVQDFQKQLNDLAILKDSIALTQRKINQAEQEEGNATIDSRTHDNLQQLREFLGSTSKIPRRIPVNIKPIRLPPQKPKVVIPQKPKVVIPQAALDIQDRIMSAARKEVEEGRIRRNIAPANMKQILPIRAQPS